MSNSPGPTLNTRRSRVSSVLMLLGVAGGVAMGAGILSYSLTPAPTGDASMALMALDDSPTNAEGAEQDVVSVTQASARLPEIELRADADLNLQPAPPESHSPEVAPAEAAPSQAPAPESDSPEAAPPKAAPPKAAPATFNGRPLRKVRTVKILTTAYSPDARSCGEWADGITASGYSVWTNGMKLVAADTSVFPFGTVVSIPGYNGGRPVPVLDRGGAIKGTRLDLLYPTHERALQWGAQRLDVTVWAYADE